MKVIFLDVDGVLNASRRVTPHTQGFELSDWVIPRCINQLNRIVRETKAAIVISSTWRIGKNIKELREMFDGVGVVGDVIGKTERGPCSWHNDLGYPMCSDGHRGAEIHDWLENRKRLVDYAQVDGFVILDDDSDLEPYRDHHVRTDLYRGLIRRHVDQAVRILEGNKT
jgi:hypothetical protein